MPEDRPVRRSLLAAAADGICESITDALTKEGRDGVGAPDGREALGLLEPRPYDLVLSDLRMPDVDGPSLYETLRTRHHSPVRFTTQLPRVIFMTGNAVDHTEFVRGTTAPIPEKPCPSGSCDRR